MTWQDAMIPTKTIHENQSEIYAGIFRINRLNTNQEIITLDASVPAKSWEKDFGDIKLFGDLREVGKVRFSDILQRNVNADRAMQIRKGYLDKSDKLIKFFPSILAVLIPRNDTSGFQKDYIYRSCDTNPWNISGITIGYHKNEAHSAQWTFYFTDLKELKSGVPLNFSWDKNKFDAVVIDGQHRLTALRELNKKEAIDIGVTFILFSPENGRELDIVRYTRELFIDVNNTARKVSDVKLIQMDDTNISRVLTRDLVLEPLYDEVDESGCWLPFGRETELKLITDSIPKCFIDFPGDDEFEKLNEVTANILPEGPALISSLTFLYKIVRDFMLGKKSGLDFEQMISLYDEGTKGQLKSLANKDDDDDETSQIKTIEELKRKVSHPNFEPKLDNVMFRYAETITYLDISKSDEHLFQFDSREIDLLKMKLTEKVVVPIQKIYSKMFWSKAIIDTLKTTLKKCKSIPEGQQIVFQFFSENCRSSIPPRAFLQENNLNVSEDHKKMEPILDEAFVALDSQSKDNVLRTSVGQRMIFWLFKSDFWAPRQKFYSSRIPATADTSRKSIAEFYVNDINTLSQKDGFFNRRFKISLRFSTNDRDLVLPFYIWEGVLCKNAHTDNPQMIPSDRAAHLGNTFLFVVLGAEEGHVSRNDLKSLSRAISKGFVGTLSTTTQVNRSCVGKHISQHFEANREGLVDLVINSEEIDESIKFLKSDNFKRGDFDQDGLPAATEKLIGCYLIQNLKNELQISPQVGIK